MATDFSKYGTKMEDKDEITTTDFSKYGSPVSAMATEPMGEKRSLLSKIGGAVTSIFPGKKVGEAIGTLAGFVISPNKEFYDTSAPSPKEVLGDIASGAATVAGLKLPVASGVMAKAAQFGGLSAVAGGGASLAEGGDVQQAAKDAFYSGLTGAAIGGAVGLAGKAVKSLASKAPDALYNNSLRVLAKLKSSGKSPTDFLVDKGLWGNLGTFKKAAEQGIKQASTKIATKAASTPGGATWGEIRKTAIENLRNSLGKDLYTTSEVAKFIDDVPISSLKTKGLLNWKAIDTVRSQLGRMIGDSKWIALNPSEKVKASQAVYRSLASLLQKTTNTTAEFAEYSKWIQTQKVVDRAIDLADSKYGLGLRDIISGVGGAAFGALGEGDVKERLQRAALFGIGGLAAERAVTSPAIRTGVAQLIKKIGSIPIDSAGKVSKTAIIRLIGDTFGR